MQASNAQKLCHVRRQQLTVVFSLTADTRSLGAQMLKIICYIFSWSPKRLLNVYCIAWVNIKVAKLR